MTDKEESSDLLKAVGIALLIAAVLYTVAYIGGRAGLDKVTVDPSDTPAPGGPATCGIYGNARCS